MINQATIKAGVEAAKKGIPMAGQKLANFFSKEGWNFPDANTSLIVDCFKITD